MPETKPVSKPSGSKLAEWAPVALADLKAAHVKHNMIDSGLLLAVLEALIDAASKE